MQSSENEAGYRIYPDFAIHGLSLMRRVSAENYFSNNALQQVIRSFSRNENDTAPLESIDVTKGDIVWIFSLCFCHQKNFQTQHFLFFFTNFIYLFVFFFKK